jgi:hypothetical protein
MDLKIFEPYISKIIISFLPLIIKLLFKKDDEIKENLKAFLKFITLLFPIGTIIWLNLDENIKDTKLTTTLIALNIGIFLFNYFNSEITKGYLSKIETEKHLNESILKINQINDVQVEKMKAINDNQHYILKEIGRINDNILEIYKTFKK